MTIHHVTNHLNSLFQEFPQLLHTNNQLLNTFPEMFRIVPRLAFRPAVAVATRRAATPLAIRTLTCSAQLRNTTSELLEVVKSEYEVATAVGNELGPEKALFLAENQFQTIDKPMGSNVQLYKKLASGEELRVFFDIDEVSDVCFPSPEIEESEVAQDNFDSEIEDYESSFANVKVLVSKPNSNDGLFFNLLLQDSEEGFLVDYFNYKSNVSEFLTQVENEGTFLSNFEYQGPRFSNLDDSLQVTMEKYLQEKGINFDLADFIFSYAEVKEEDSYRELLNNVSKYLSK